MIIALLATSLVAAEASDFVGTWKGEKARFGCGPDGQTCSMYVSVTLQLKDGVLGGEAIAGEKKSDSMGSKVTLSAPQPLANGCVEFPMRPKAFSEYETVDAPPSAWNSIEFCSGYNAKGEPLLSVKVIERKEILRFSQFDSSWFHPVKTLRKQK